MIFHVTYISTLFRRRCLQVFALMAALDVVCCAQIPPPSDSDRLDSRFLSELNKRRLYDLATDFARDRMRGHSLEESRAFWVDQLATVYRLRTWEESGGNRQALTEQSIESITQYLSEHEVSPETNLALRLNQIEGLLNLARMNHYLHTVGRRGPLQEAGQAESVGVLPFLDRATELAEALLRQLDRNRGQLDSRLAGQLRERGKRLAIEVDVVRWLTLAAATGAGGDVEGESQSQRQSELRSRLKSLHRSARQLTTRQTAEQLLAELQLINGDHDQLELTLRSRNSSLTDSQRSALEIRSLLRQGKATEALQKSHSLAGGPADVGSEPAVLRLESLLLLRMLADDLQDASLLRRSDQQFARYSETARQWPASVWKDAALIVAQRCQLIQTVGTEVAALVEHVESLRAAGQPDEAFHELQRAYRLLPPRASAQSRGAIQLRMGEILISQQEWEAAVSVLQNATRLFSEAGQPAPASTAELLTVFSIGQRWKQAPQNVDLQQQYYDGLIQHRLRWPGQTSRQQSTAWLVQLTQHLDPLYAAEILAEEAAAEQSVSQRIRSMIQFGEQLERARWMSQETRSGSTWAELTNRLTRLCDRFQLIDDPLTEHTARLLLLKVSLTTDATTTWDVWNSLRQKLTAASRTITDGSPETQNRLQRLLLVATARTATDSGIRQQQQQEFLSGSRADQLQTARQLARYLSRDGLTQPGDSLIASTIDTLLRQRMARPSSTADLTEMLELAARTYRVTDDDSVRSLLLRELLATELTTDQTMKIAAVLVRFSDEQSADSISQQARFWQRVRNSSAEGSDLWLESCLQSAMIQHQQGKPEEAARQLRVTTVIYPEWGSEQRRQRVKEFLRNL